MAASDAVIQGSQIDLTNPQGEGAPLDEQTHPPNVKLKFTHLAVAEGGSPIANARALVRADTGTVMVGGWSVTTNPSGELEFYVGDECEEVDVTLYANESHPDLYKRPLRFKVHLVESLESADELPGARMRLRNLGYLPGVDVEESELDEATRDALRGFQLEAEKPLTGKLDRATKESLRELYDE